MTPREIETADLTVAFEHQRGSRGAGKCAGVLGADTMTVVTDQPSAEELVSDGVPYEDILRGLRPASICQGTEFAVG